MVEASSEYPYTAVSDFGGWQLAFENLNQKRSKSTEKSLRLFFTHLQEPPESIATCSRDAFSALECIDHLGTAYSFGS